MIQDYTNLLSTNYPPSTQVFFENRAVNLLVIHHTAGPVVSPNIIAEHHVWSRKWYSIGYHYLIYPDGQIIKCLPHSRVGPHCKGHNTRSIGIAAVGNYSIDRPSGPMKRSIVHLGRVLDEIYNFEEIKGHRELAATECPGLYFPLEVIRDLIKKKFFN